MWSFNSRFILSKSRLLSLSVHLFKNLRLILFLDLLIWNKFWTKGTYIKERFLPDDSRFWCLRGKWHKKEEVNKVFNPSILVSICLAVFHFSSMDWKKADIAEICIFKVRIFKSKLLIRTATSLQSSFSNFCNFQAPICKLYFFNNLLCKNFPP